MSLQSALINIINGKPFCCLCLKTVDIEVIRVQDEVVFEAKTTQTVYDILTSIVGSRISINISLDDPVCDTCIRSAINSYNFINMCRQNSQRLYSTITSLTNLQEFVDSVEYKSVFVTVDTTEFSNKFYYDSMSPVGYDSLFKRLQYLLEQEKETKLDYHCEDDFCLKYSESSDDNIKDMKYENVLTTKKKVQKVKDDTNLIHTRDLMHQNNKRQCKFCLKILTTSQRLRDHYFRVHAPKDFKCSKCPRRYGRKALLDEHLLDCHTIAVCSECGKTYNNKGSLKQHELGHKTKVICATCGKSYKTKMTLRTHICQIQRTKLERIFTCDHCGKGYGRKGSLLSHIRFEHSSKPKKVFVCSWCKKKWPSDSALKCHMLTHTKEKNFPCEVCGGKFVSKASLLYHNRTHTGEKPYKCELCDRRFLSVSRRTEHVRRIHNGPTVACDICDSKFKSRACLRRHKRRHFNPKSKLYCSDVSNDNTYSKAI